MASEEMRKKWGTIFMGEREASVEQLNAMQEPLLRKKRQREESEDYVERVRAKAADRAREILGAAYTERQKVLEEAKAEAALQKSRASQECARIIAEGEAARKLAQSEREKARAELEEAEKIREAAHEEGFQAGMDKAGIELQEFRAELGQSLAELLRAIERQRHNILESWRADLAELAKCAAQAGSGFLLRTEHNDILKSLVFQALDLLENRSVITMRVNPSDEATVSNMFQAARERVPELKQWIVTGDEQVEEGGLLAESGSGSVDLQRKNFREMVDGILAHLALPELESEARNANDVRELLEREVAHIASLTPEPDQPAAGGKPDLEQPVEAAEPETEPENAAGEAQEPGVVASEPPAEASSPESAAAESAGVRPEEGLVSPRLEADLQPDDDQEIPGYDGTAAAALELDSQAREKSEETPAADPSIEELEKELFPIDSHDASAPGAAGGSSESGAGSNSVQKELPDPRTLAEGGFL